MTAVSRIFLVSAFLSAPSILAAETKPDAGYESFRKAMLPRVGQTVTVAGKLDAGKHGWWVSAGHGGFYLKATATNQSDTVRFNAIGRLRGQQVIVMGTLYHQAERRSADPLVSGIQDHFFFKVSDLAISSDQPRTPHTP